MTESAEGTPRPPKPPEGAPELKQATAWENIPIPEPVLWRQESSGSLLAVGECAILASAGGLGKSMITLSIADAARSGGTGAACGLRVRPGPVVLISYEDAPERIWSRLAGINSKEPPEHIHLWADPFSLWEGGDNGGKAHPFEHWSELWTQIRAVRPTLVILDPISAAMVDVDTSQTGPVRAFMRELVIEAKKADCGVLLVAHDTKGARNEAKAGRDPGAGAVAGSASWYDAARGVLYLRREPGNSGRRLLECLKSNYGPSGWGAVLRERMAGERLAALELEDDGLLSIEQVDDWHQRHAARAGNSGKADAYEGEKPEEVALVLDLKKRKRREKFQNEVKQERTYRQKNPHGDDDMEIDE